jgi:hypothetical protein
MPNATIDGLIALTCSRLEPPPKTHRIEITYVFVHPIWLAK